VRGRRLVISPVVDLSLDELSRVYSEALPRRMEAI
jgi:hypothetical protein